MKFSRLIILCFLLTQKNVYASKNENSDFIRIQTTEMGLLPWHPLASISTQWVFKAAVFKGLLNFDSNFNLKKGLFKNWNWIEQDKCYLLTIDSSIRYHNGKELDIFDIEFAIVKLRLSNIPIFRNEILHDIVGFENLQSGKRFKPGLVEGIKVINADKMKICLKERNPNFLYTLAFVTPGVSPRSEFKKDYFSYKNLPIGTGLYKVIDVDEKKVSVKTVLTTEKVDSNLIPRVEFIEKGHPLKNNLDIALNTAAQSVSNSNLFNTVTSKFASSIVVLDFNYSNRLSQKKAFRKTISLVIDRREIWRGYKGFEPAHDLSVDHLIGNLNEKYEENPKKAIKTAQQKFPNQKINLWFHGFKGEETPVFLQIMGDQLKTLGWEVNFIPTSNHYFSERDTSINGFIYSSAISLADPSLIFGLYLNSRDMRLHSPKKNKKAEDIYKKVLKEPSTTKKSELLKSLARNFKENYIQIPIGQKYHLVAFSKKIQQIEKKHISNTINFEKLSLSK